MKYVETLLRCDQEEDFAQYENTICAFEQVILALDTGFLFARKTLSTHVKDLQQLREEAFNHKGSWSLVYARCQGLAQGLLSIYMEKRVKKDLATFDQQLFDFIRSDTTLSFNENTLHVLQKLSDQHIHHPNAKMEELALAPAQKTITGLNGGSSAYILDLLQLRKHVHLQQRRILTEPLTLKEKAGLIKALATDLRQGLQQCQKQFAYAFIGYTASGRRELFTKTYLDARLLSAEEKPRTPDPTLLLIK